MLWLGQGLVVVGIVFVLLLAALRPVSPDTVSADEYPLISSASSAPRVLGQIFFVCSDEEAAWVRDVRGAYTTVYTVIADITPQELVETLRTRVARGQLEIAREDDCD